MEFFILDNSESKTKVEKSVAMMWISALISEWTYVSGGVAFLIYLYKNWDNLPEKQKYFWTIEVMKRNPKVSDEYLKTYEGLYETIRRGRKIKHKDRQLLIHATKAERLLNMLYKDTKTYYKNLALSTKYFELLDLIDINKNNWTKPLLLFSMENTNDEGMISNTIETVVNFFKAHDCIPFIDGDIKNNMRGKEMGNLGMMLWEPEYVSDFIFEMPPPESLNSSQLVVVRNKLSTVFWEYFNMFEKLNEEMKNIVFAKANLNLLIDLYHQKTKELKVLLQKTIDENELLNELKTGENKNVRYKIYAGISSYTNLLRYYSKSDRINEGTATYTKEEVDKDLKTENSHMFLFWSTV